MIRETKLLPPIMPNFIRYEQPIRKRQDGPIFSMGIDIIDLTEKEAEEYGELMKQAFIDHWGKRCAAQKKFFSGK